MSSGAVGMLFAAATFLAMFSGLPIAIALGTVALGFIVAFAPAAIGTLAQGVYTEMSSLTLLSIPLFILKGSAIGKTRAGQDVYLAIHAWLNRIPGGLGVANIFACALFAAMSGSSPATCSAMGAPGIPEMRHHGYSDRLATGIIAAGGTLGILLPPSVTLILYAVAAQQSLGRLFLAGIGPGLLLVGLFSAWTMLSWTREHAQARAVVEAGGPTSPILRRHDYTMRERVKTLPRVIPFVVLLIGVMVALYGGLATPSETAGLGAVMALLLVGFAYRMKRWRDFSPIISATVRESSMLMLIIGMSGLYAYAMSYLHISQEAASAIVGLGLSPWLLLGTILLMVVVLGFFLPPVSIILMTGPIIFPPLTAAGFDLVWFGVIMMIVMEMGLIHPPVGLNIFVISNIAPDIKLREIIMGTLPFVGLMVIAVVLLCLLPGIAMWLPNGVMG